MPYDANSFLHGIELGRALKGTEVTGGGGRFWTGENLLTEAQLNLSNWNKLGFQTYQNAYQDGVNDMNFTVVAGIFDRFYLAETLEPYTTYVFTGLYRSVSGTTIEESYEPTFYGERNAVLTQTPGTGQLHDYGIMSLSVPLDTNASQVFKRYTAFAFSTTAATVYITIDCGKYQDGTPTHVQWKDLCFAVL